MTIYSREVIDEDQEQKNKGKWIAEMIDLTPLKIKECSQVEGYRCDRCGVIFLHPSLICDYCGDKKQTENHRAVVVSYDQE